MKHHCIGVDEGFHDAGGVFTYYTFSDGSMRIEPYSESKGLTDDGLVLTSEFIEMLNAFRMNRILNHCRLRKDDVSPGVGNEVPK